MNQEKKMRLGALDVCIIVAAIVCVVGLGLRTFSKSEAVVNNGATMENYVVSFTVANIRGSSVKYFNKGDVFFLKENTTRFGELIEKSELPAQKYYTDINGNSVYVMNESTDDRTKRMDVTGSLLVSGVTDEEGRFLLNGTQYLGANKEVEIKSKYITVNVKITSIAKATERQNG